MYISHECTVQRKSLMVENFDKWPAIHQCFSLLTFSSSCIIKVYNQFVKSFACPIRQTFVLYGLLPYS